MKTVTPELLALIATRQFWVADLWNITLNSGVALHYTTADVDIIAGGITYKSASHLFSRSRITQKLGVEVATLDVNIYPNTTDLVNDLPFMQAVRRGYFDAAEVQVLRAFMPSVGDVSAGTIILFAGRMGDIQCGRTSAACTINSHLELLNVKVPRTVYQAPCPFNLFDSNCGASASAFVQATTVGAGATTTSVPVGISEVEGWGAQGILTFTSGVCAGLTRMVVKYEGNVCTIYPPTPSAPAAGDSVTVSPGCDKSWPGPTPGTYSVNIPNTSPYRVTVSAATEDNGVVGTVTTYATGYDGDGNPYSYVSGTSSVTFTKVTGTPGTNQYSFSGGVYTFAAANAGQAVVISYTNIAATGCGRFSNLARFGGQPYVPAPSTTT